MSRHYSSSGTEYERQPAYGDYLADYNARRGIATQEQRDAAQAARFAQLSRRRDALAAAGATGLPDLSPNHSKTDMDDVERRLNGFTQDPATGRVRPATRAEIAAGQNIDPEQLAAMRQNPQTGRTGSTTAATATADEGWWRPAQASAAPASGPVRTPRPALDPLTGLPAQTQPSALAAQREAESIVPDGGASTAATTGARPAYGKIGQSRSFSDPASPAGEISRTLDAAGNTIIKTAGGGTVTLPASQPQTPPSSGSGGSGISVNGIPMNKNAAGEFAPASTAAGAAPVKGVGPIGPFNLAVTVPSLNPPPPPAASSDPLVLAPSAPLPAGYAAGQAARKAVGGAVSKAGNAINALVDGAGDAALSARNAVGGFFGAAPVSREEATDANLEAIDRYPMAGRTGNPNASPAPDGQAHRMAGGYDLGGLLASAPKPAASPASTGASALDALTAPASAAPRVALTTPATSPTAVGSIKTTPDANPFAAPAKLALADTADELLRRKRLAGGTMFAGF